MLDLARRAVACKHWRWMAGMLCVDSKTKWRWRILWVEEDAVYAATDSNRGYITAVCAEVRSGHPIGFDQESLHRALSDGPDLADPATLGCLLALAREAWDAPSLCANDAGNYDLMFWHVYTGDRNVSIGCETEAEALVIALEGAQ